MKKMINAVQMVKKENGNYDVINYRSPIFVDGVAKYVFAFNFPYDMALQELKRAETRVIRKYGTYLIEKEGE